MYKLLKRALIAGIIDTRARNWWDMKLSTFAIALGGDPKAKLRRASSHYIDINIEHVSAFEEEKG
jgi:hypothetical protein